MHMFKQNCQAGWRSRLLCLLLAAGMMGGAVSCGMQDISGETTEDTAAPTDTEMVTEDASETIDPDDLCDLPDDLDYKGETLCILLGDKSELMGEMNGGLVSASVYERNLQVEEDLGVTLELREHDPLQISNTMRADIMSGDGAYDIVANATYLIMEPALEGMYVNLSVLENIDRSKNYWSQSYSEMMTYTDADIQFLVSGPIALSMYRYPFLTMYNKQLFEDCHVPDLYDTVQSGGWTLDYQYAISKGHYLDQDGDGQHSVGDRYGFFTGNVINVDPYNDCADIRLIVKDPETGLLEWNNDALLTLSDLCDKVQKLYNDESTYVVDWSILPYETIIEQFAEGNALMITAMFREVEKYCDPLAAITYGVAPMPKFSEDQVGYRTRVQDSVSGFGISAVVTEDGRREMLAAVLESMAYHSNNLTRPAYYENTLSKRFMQDPQSVEMLDLIFASIRFDFGMAWSGEFRDKLRPLLSGTSNTIASATKMWHMRAERILDDYNEDMEAIKQEIMGG